MQIAFCVNASAAIGGGHVMRCLTLANEIVRRGGTAAFFVNAEAITAAAALGRSGLPVVVTSDAVDDGRAAVQRVFPGGVDWVLFDDYRRDASHEKALRAVAARIAVIDDLANRPHDCDLLIDTTLGRQSGDYRGLVPADCELLLGAGYALLRPAFAAMREPTLARRAISSTVGRIIVSLGLTDVGGITGNVVDALLEADIDAGIDVVIAPAAQSRATLERMAACNPRITLHIDPPDMARLMAEADIAIGAAGTTSWERCCLGLPTVLVVLADNQKLIAETLASAGAAVLVGGSAGPLPDQIAAAAVSLFAALGRRRAMALAAAAIVDGEGARRVAQRFFELAK